MATTVTKTIKSSGGDYTSLSAWEAGQQGDLTGVRDEIARAVCYAIDDTTEFGVDGWTTSATQYITMECDATARHAGVWNGAKYNLIGSSANVLSINEEYVRIDGLQIGNAAVGGTQSPIVSVNTRASGANELRISNCLIKAAGSATYPEPGIRIEGANSIVNIFNCIVYGLGNVDNYYASGMLFAGDNITAKVYSSTCIGGKFGLLNWFGTGITVAAKNVYCGGTATSDFSGTITETNCASEDTSAGGTNHTHANVDTDTFVNVTAGSEDFHLAADGLSPLQGAGVDTSGESAPLNFTTDIDGDTISNWSIGADDGVASGDTLLTVAACAFTHASSTPTLVELRTLAVGAVALTHAASTPTLVELRTLAVASAALAHAASTPTMVENRTLAVQAAALGHAADNIVLTQAHTLAVQSADLAHAASVPTLNELRTLVVSPATLTHASENVEVVPGSADTELVISAAALTLAAEVVALAQAHRLSVSDAALALATIGPTLTMIPNTALVVGAAAIVLEAQEIMMLALTESLLHSEEMTPRQYTQGSDPRDYTQDSELRPYTQKADPREYTQNMTPRPRIVEVAPRLRP